MAKISNPFMSLKATGSIGRTISIGRRAQSYHVCKFPTPKTSPTPAQAKIRDDWRHIMAGWQNRESQGDNHYYWGLAATAYSPLWEGINRYVDICMQWFVTGVTPQLTYILEIIGFGKIGVFIRDVDGNPTDYGATGVTLSKGASPETTEPWLTTDHYDNGMAWTNFEQYNATAFISTSCAGLPNGATFKRWMNPSD